jgi:glycosyltransferase involved in cell wall biosynthesis
MLLKNPLVSVIVPSYNRAELVINAMESVWSQTYRPVELVVVDDGSTDGTRDKVLKWAKGLADEADFEVLYFHQKNQGANAARNLGIQHAKGELVAFIDSDDRWVPDKLGKQIPLFFDDPEVGGVYCGLGWIDLVDNQRMPDGSRVYPEGWLLPKLLVHDVTAGTPCYVIKKECFDKVGLFDVSLPARQDWDMWIRLSAEYKIVSVHEVLVYAGKHIGERLSSNAKESIKAQWIIFNKYASLRRRFPFSVRKSAKGALFRRLGRIYFHYGLSKQTAIVMYLKSIFAWPFCFDTYAAFAGIFMPANLRQKLHILWNRVFGKTRLAIKSF